MMTIKDAKRRFVRRMVHLEADEDDDVVRVLVVLYCRVTVRCIDSLGL